MGKGRFIGKGHMYSEGVLTLGKGGLLLLAFAVYYFPGLRSGVF